jgi:peptidyl-prolyl cis-trans isomerase B (cyclophilin B)
VKKGFFDGTIFHRIVPGFVIQGGDPTGTGTGGPGYSTVDVPPSDARYTKGVVAMAKAGNEPPGTAGSQFFVVTAEDARLPPEYALLGKVTSGMDVVEKIGTLGDPQTEQPTKRIVIEKATLGGR